eukprot:989025-Rhodomonas_salina.1
MCFFKDGSSLQGSDAWVVGIRVRGFVGLCRRRVYTWGSNSHGQLGLGGVALGADVSAAASCSDQTVMFLLAHTARTVCVFVFANSCCCHHHEQHSHDQQLDYHLRHHLQHHIIPLPLPSPSSHYANRLFFRVLRAKPVEYLLNRDVSEVACGRFQPNPQTLNPEP